MSQQSMTDRPRHGGTFRNLFVFSFAWAAILSNAQATRAADPNPLRPADTSSPQATLKSFLDNTNQAYRLVAQKGEKGDPSDTMVYRLRAIRCLDSSKIAPTAAEDVADKRAVLLSEIFDRIELPDPKSAPDAREAAAKKITRWRIPNTEITIVQMTEGPRQGEFLFSADTVARIPEFYERVKHLPYKPGTVLKNAYDKLFTTGQPAPQNDDPLKPADTSSPQATLKSFIDSMNALYRAYKARGSSESGADARRAHLGRALRCLNLSKVPSKALEETENQAAVLLMEVFDRVKIPPYETIPGAPEVKKDNITSWKIPNTEITIARVEEGPRKGEFLFTPETVSRARSFYDHISHLPYKDGTVLEDAYHLYLQSPGPSVPVSWLLNMPAWLKVLVLGQPVWKWIASLVILLLLLAGSALAFRIGIVKRPTGEPASLRRRLVVPLSGLCMTYLAEAALKQLRPVQEVALLVSIASTLLIAACLAWLIAIVSSALAEAVVRFPRLNAREIDAQLIRIAFRLLTLAGFVVIVILTADNLGIPLTPVLAGLGVGGIAVALAAQNSIENLIGGFTLFMDRPVRVGDSCRFGDKIGTIEEIGLRSTCVRTLDDTVISIPNAAFAKMELENFSRRRKIWYHPRLQLEKTSSADQVRFVLVEVRKMLYSHPRVDPDKARIRFAEFGPSSLDLDVFAYIPVTDSTEYLEIAEDLNLRIMEILARGGLRLAVPAQRTLVEPGLHPDPERAQQTEKQVQHWREHQQLYLPSFPEEVVAQLRESLDYPPKGAPAADRQAAPAKDRPPNGRSSS
jgi:MscS family membrane protein